MTRINIAIDGPSAAGKSTIADILAAKLDYIHLDTGAMYRAFAVKAIQEGLALDDEESLVACLRNTKIDVYPDGTIKLDGKTVNQEIRTDKISLAASDVSKLKGVREELVARQKEMATKKGVIMDGRDIGTVVLPDAEVKIYLTASAKARAMRRYLQNKEKGIKNDLATLTKEIEARDYQDSHRANSPLKKAEDAIEVDTSDLTIDATVATILQIVDRRTKPEE